MTARAETQSLLVMQDTTMLLADLVSMQVGPI